ncbi:MAG TPA: putative metal-dependent hydrolase [Bacteroidota bacterium]|jgi:hypothetical protein
MNIQERSRLIEKIKELPRQAEDIVRGLNDDQLNTPYRDGGWTPRQVIHHLADSHMNAVIRMKLILTEDHPTLKTYDQNEWAVLADTNESIQSSLSILKGLHERWGILLGKVKDSEWSRKAEHPESGEITLKQLLVTYARHGENHVAQISNLRKAKSW